MNNSIPQISAIVPCYKVEQFLEKCVNSILTQSFSDFEIILVDDGSPDCSGKIADELASRDKRIKVVHKKNGGVVKARETGVELAQGKWITFIDSDDSVTSNAFENLIKAAEGKDTDIVIGFPLGMRFPNVPEGYSVEDYRRDVISGQRIQPAPWGRLIRKSIISPFMFEISRDVKRGDDMIFNIRCAFATEKAPVIVKSYVYDYYTNENSIVNTNAPTPEFETYYHTIRMQSIPKEEQSRYMDAIISDRFHSIQRWSYHNPQDKSWMDSPFVLQLIKDIKEYNYSLSLKQRVLLSPNTLIRLGGVNLYHICDYLKK